MNKPTTAALKIRTSRRQDHASWIVSIIVCVVTTCFFVGLSTQFWHWFVIPTAIGAILIARDGVEWLRGRLDVFDPVGLIGLYGLHYFLFAPFLHVLWDFWWNYRFTPLDWRPWLGGLALLNILGLIGYRVVRMETTRRLALPRKRWRLNERKFWIVMPVLLAATALLQFWVYRDFGGMANYVHSYEDSLGVWGNPFPGQGWKFTLSESFPILSAITYIVLSRKHRVLRSAKYVALFLIVQLGFELVFGGFRGSRNNVIVGLFWAIGLVHLYIKPITRKQILVGALAVFAYMNVYYFYKHAGLEGLLSIANTTSRDTIVGRKGTGDEQKFILLHDFARADIQALALYLLWSNDDYEYALGRSYFGGVASVVPSAIWSGRPQTFRKERTELLYGQRSPSRRYAEAQVPWIFGAPGEAMLNLGPLAAPVPFLLWGVVVGWVALLYRKLPRDDTRTMLLPMLIGVSALVFIGDSHVFFMLLVKDGLVPLVAIWLISDRVSIAHR